MGILDKFRSQLKQASNMMQVLRMNLDLDCEMVTVVTVSCVFLLLVEAIFINVGCAVKYAFNTS